MWQSLFFAVLSRMVAELRLEMPWSPSYDPSKFENFVSLLSHFRLIIVSIARSRHSESNGCGITSGDALEPEL